MRTANQYSRNVTHWLSWRGWTGLGVIIALILGLLSFWLRGAPVEATEIVSMKDLEEHWVGLGQATVEWPEWIIDAGPVKLTIDGIDQVDWEDVPRLRAAQEDDLTPEPGEERPTDLADPSTPVPAELRDREGQLEILTKTEPGLLVFDEMQATLWSTNGAFTVTLIGFPSETRLITDPVEGASWSWLIKPAFEYAGCPVHDLTITISSFGTQHEIDFPVEIRGPYCVSPRRLEDVNVLQGSLITLVTVLAVGTILWPNWWRLVIRPRPM